MATNLITLKLVVDKSRNRVVFAESNSHFVEILLSFLTLPLGSIIRLTNKQPMGSLHKLFESVENLNSNCFVSEGYRSMLLRPLNSAAKQCSKLPMICDDNSFAIRYGYICSDYFCGRRLSFYARDQCSCGMVMDRKVQLVPAAEPKNDQTQTFVFIISDDLVVSLPTTEKTIELLAKFGIEEWKALESIQVDVTAEKIIELLKRLLVSDTPLTDVFLSGQNENKMESFKLFGRQKCNETVRSTASKRIPVKLLFNEDNKLLFAEADNEFADLLVSFLTYPMSSVVNMLDGQCGIQCLDNLYKFIESLGSTKFLNNKELIDILLSQKFPPCSMLKNQLIKFEELPVTERYCTTERYYMCRTSECYSNEVSTIPNVTCKGCQKITNKRLTLTNPLDNSTIHGSTGGFMMSAIFVVTDDLIIKQFSPAIVATDFIKKYERINARNVEIGEDEAFALLRASISTGNVLTDALVGNKEG